MSELMLHTKMSNVQIHATHEYEMCCIRTNVTHIYIRSYVTHENVMSCVRTYVTYKNV